MPRFDCKRNALVVIPYALFTLALFGLLGLEKITWVQFVAGLAALNLPTVFGIAKDDRDPPAPPPVPLFVITGAMALGVVTSGCSLLTRSNAKTALDAAQIACVFSSFESDASVLAKACAVSKELFPLLRDLIGQREGARRAGVHWPDPDSGISETVTDGGQQPTRR